MKNSKFNYTTVRIYSQDLTKSLDEAFKRTETSFASNRSAFLVHFIELGLGAYMSELQVKRLNPIEDTPFQIPTDIEDLSEMLDQYIIYSGKSNEKSEEKLEICEGLADAIFNILLDSLEGKFVDKEAADAGKYDNVPKRFKKGNGKV